MKKNFYWLLLAMFGVTVLVSCSDEDDDIRVSDVPTAVLDVFEAKFPNVSRPDWENKQGYYVADFWQEGIETQVWMSNLAEWKMTEYDLGTQLSLLPNAVQSAFQASEYAAWRVDDLEKYVRTDMTFYQLEIETPGQADRDLFFREDGTLLKDAVDKDNDEVTPGTVF